MPSCCDLLSKSYLWYIEYSLLPICYHYHSVVICFQNRTFDILNTAIVDWLSKLASCDLLSKSYLWYIEYSLQLLQHCHVTVVICFQNRTFDILNTALIFCSFVHLSLWFAFKIVPLIYWIQLIMCIVFIISNISSKLELKKLAVFLKINRTQCVFFVSKIVRAIKL